MNLGGREKNWHVWKSLYPQIFTPFAPFLLFSCCYGCSQALIQKKLILSNI